MILPHFSVPLDVYLCKKEECKRFAEDCNVKTLESNIVLQLQMEAHKSSVINSQYTKWKKKLLNDRTWAAVNLFFLKAFADVDDLDTVLALSLIGANAIVHKPRATTSQPRATDVSLQPKVVSAMDNLTMVAIAKNTTMEEMSSSINFLTTINASLAKEVFHLSTLCSKFPPNGDDGNNGNGSKTKVESDPSGYCWAHGYRVCIRHNGMMCISRALGHKTEATKKNSMGGRKRSSVWGNAPNGSERSD